MQLLPPPAQPAISPDPIVPISGLALLHTLKGHIGIVWDMAWSPAGERLASCSDDGTVRVWDTTTGKELHTLKGHTNRVQEVRWSPAGDWLASCSRDATVRVWNTTTGKELHTLKGHTSAVWDVAWSPEGKRLASCSHDGTVRVWDAITGKEQCKLEGHTSSVWDVRWSSEGKQLASCSIDETVRVWDMTMGEELHTLKGHRIMVWGARWSPEGKRLASCSIDETVRVWDVTTGKELHTLKGHTGAVWDIAWSPNGKWVASCSTDGTVRVWDVTTGKELHRLEGHTGLVCDVEWSPDGKMLASGSERLSAEVRIWRTDTWKPVAVINSLHSSCGRLATWHPHLPLMVTAGKREQDLFVWQLNQKRLLHGISSPKTVHYRNAKVVVVGDSGVGKSGLTLALTGQPFVPTLSNHGRHVWLLDQQQVLMDSELHETRETWLWDLAGQRDYRLIHQLHLHEATIALIVFDSARETDPFAGVRHWHHALRQAHQARGPSALPLTVFLVAARIDCGGRNASRQQVNALVQELGCAGYLETSAKDGLGICELGQAIRAALDWTALPMITSTELLQAIKKFILHEQQTEQLLRTVDELYQSFLRVPGAPAPSSELQQQFKAAFGRLDALGHILNFSFGNLVLLQPERLDAYMSALLIAVTREPDDLGSIPEERVQQGQFAIPQEVRLRNREKLLLIAMIEELVSCQIVLREGGSLLFPSQSTCEHPEHETLASKQIVTFTFAGSVKDIYTKLVVRLAQCGIFQKQGLWQHVVTYTTTLGGNYGLLLSPRGEEGQAELGLFFDESTLEEIRFLFEDFVRLHLERHTGGTVQRRRRFVCPACGDAFTEAQVSKRRERGHSSIDCNVCGTSVSLLDGTERLSTSSPSLVAKMEMEADAQRDQERASSKLEGKKMTQDFDVFLCHHGQDKPAVREIYQKLKEHGILPWLDEEELRPGLPWQRALEEQIPQIKSAAVFVGPNGLGPWEHNELDAFLREFARRGCPVIPVLLTDAPQEPALPMFLNAMTWVDFREQDPDPMERLVWGISGRRDWDARI